jgi:hypothetical protein
MRWPWKRQARLIEPRVANARVLELETAKEILAEVFGSRPGVVEEMIQRRPRGEELDRRDSWPATFPWVSSNGPKF